MNADGTAGRLLVGVAVMFLLGGCAAGASPTPAPASPSPSSVVATPTPTATVTATPAPTPSVVVTRNVAYESANPVFTPGVLDVHAPGKAGPWPVVVMFHGQPPSMNSKETLYSHATRVAELGFVVFVATWGHGWPEAEPTYRWAEAARLQTACAVAFARAHAAEYGGDAATMIVFGHSAGANLGAVVAFARPTPAAGCLGGTTLGAIDALVTWEGDWALADFAWDSGLADDPALMDAATPWKSLAQHQDLKVVMLVSANPGPYVRPLDDPKVMDSFFVPRDPSGVLRKRFDGIGALADSSIDITDEQRLLFSVLKAQGNPVSLDVMPDSSHDGIGGAGWEVFLAAFGKAVARE
jgi:acetyl esterase/lipase